MRIRGDSQLKKFIALLSAILLTLSISGCGTNKKTDTTKKEISQKPAVVSTDESSNPSENPSGNQSENPSVKPAEKPTESPPGSTPEEPSAFKAFEPLILSDISGLSTKANGWSWEYSPGEYASLLAKYHGYAFGDTSQKIIYLTFDEGYENGYTASILDILKANDVKAAFFCTKPFVTGSFNGVKNEVLVKRMAAEGHIIGNHSVQHKSMPGFLDEAAFDAELTGVEQAVDSIPGCQVAEFFRPPMGEFSELSLYYTQKLGYRSVFFAFAYKDYDINNQPDPTYAKEFILQHTKPGMICLLHAVSKTNAEILDGLIKEWKSEGYVFKSLNDL